MYTNGIVPDNAWQCEKHEIHIKVLDTKELLLLSKFPLTFRFLDVFLNWFYFSYGSADHKFK